MRQISLAKYRKSSRFAKPDNCDTLFQANVHDPPYPAFFNRPKKRSAEDFVKPIVKSFTDTSHSGLARRTNSLVGLAHGVVLIGNCFTLGSICLLYQLIL